MAKRSSIIIEGNDLISFEGNYNKSSKLWTQDSSFRKINFIIVSLFYENERLMWYECLWGRRRILIASP
jgi:hypothetical protein